MRTPLILILGLALDLPLGLGLQAPRAVGVFSAHNACPLALDSDLDSEGRQAGMRGAQVWWQKFKVSLCSILSTKQEMKRTTATLGPTSLVCVANIFETPSCN